MMKSVRPPRDCEISGAFVCLFVCFFLSFFLSQSDSFYLLIVGVEGSRCT
jgi:hypothetical protein